MRILVVGAGPTGGEVLRQLFKNPRLTVLTLDPRDNPHAVAHRIIPQVDFKEVLTPLTLEKILKQARPDLILLATTTSDMGWGSLTGVDMLASAMRDELATISDVPVIAVSRSGQR